MCTWVLFLFCCSSKRFILSIYQEFDGSVDATAAADGATDVINVSAGDATAALVNAYCLNYVYVHIL